MPLDRLMAHIPENPTAATKVESAFRAVGSLGLSSLERMRLGVRLFDEAMDDSSVRACLEFIRMHHPTPAQSIDIEDGVHQMRDEQDELEVTNADAA